MPVTRTAKGTKHPKNGILPQQPLLVVAYPWIQWTLFQPLYDCGKEFVSVFWYCTPHPVLMLGGKYLNLILTGLLALGQADLGMFLFVRYEVIP
ncbi:MAG: hypothetical protein DWI28_01945 [Planctomycetota bacterium]|nr:MAG: hypothetical protein DWI28_01945 [Planctomycetota bacterium]